MRAWLWLWLCAAGLAAGAGAGGGKYSRAANQAQGAGPLREPQAELEFRALHKPFRMAKLNLLWSKAQQRLTEPKLKSLYSDLMIHDKEEIAHKRLKSEGKDKDGLREAALRKRLSSIMKSFGLIEHFETVNNPEKYKEHAAYNGVVDDHINKSLFKDKKLAMLWAKAEVSGFTSDELSALKDEFHHHQDKIEQYYTLLRDVEEGKKDADDNAVNKEELDKFNELESLLEDNDIPKGMPKEYLDKANLVRDKHRNIRDNYDRLQRITAKGPKNKEFLEPKVQGLWRMAIQANFTTDELASLKTELHHYEARLLKLRHLHADHVSNVDKHLTKVAATGDKMDHLDEAQQMIKKHTRKVEKLHEDLENRILERHTEL